MTADQIREMIEKIAEGEEYVTEFSPNPNGSEIIVDRDYIHISEGEGDLIDSPRKARELGILFINWADAKDKADLTKAVDKAVSPITDFS